MSETSLRVMRKVKINGEWIMAAVPVEKGKPDASHVLVKGNLVEVTGGTFYLDHGHGAGRKRMTCGKDAEAVRRALRTQTHVLELRNRGMDVDDAPEIENRRQQGNSLREVARRFKKEPPPGIKHRTYLKYRNSMEDFAEWAAREKVLNVEDVKTTTIARWIEHLKKTLEPKTIHSKVTVIRGQLKRLGNHIDMERGTLPRCTKRKRKIYTLTQLKAFFHTCTLDEFELFSTYALTGMRNAEVMHFGVSDLDRNRAIAAVTAKLDLGFEPKTYEEREISTSFKFVNLLERRKGRLLLEGHDLFFGTRPQPRRGNPGGKPDKNHLEKLKQVAFRGGHNCGHCVGKYRGKTICCKEGPVCQQWTLHKFRHTYATQQLRDKMDIATVSEMLGHKDLSTTQIYLRALKAEAAQPQVEASTLANYFEDVLPTKIPGDRRVSRTLGSQRRIPVMTPPIAVSLTNAVMAL